MDGCIYRTQFDLCGKNKEEDEKRGIRRCCDFEGCEDKHPSNADRIRSMTDEELAGFIAPCDCLDCPLNNEETWCSATEKGCRDSILAWLKQEVDG